MGIKDITLSENIHTITAAIENKKENFDTENKMREDLLKKIRDLVQETPAEDGSRREKKEGKPNGKRKFLENG